MKRKKCLLNFIALIISALMLFLAVPISANSGPDRDTVHKLIDDSMDWLLHTHCYTDGDLYESVNWELGGWFHGTNQTLKDYVDPNKQLMVDYDRQVSGYLVYQNVTYHDWHSYNDMYTEAADIFCGEWVERSVHSLISPTELVPEDYNHFIEKDGELYVCTGWVRGSEENSLDDFFIRTPREKYYLLGSTQFHSMNKHIYSVNKMEECGAYIWDNPKIGYYTYFENAYDDYIFKIVSADSNKATAEVVVFDTWPVRMCACKATLELENTENGWRISGGSLIETLYEGKTLDKMSEEDFVAFLADVGVKEVNPPLQNPETGDDSAVRVVLLATAAVMCAVIPVMATVKRRRRED